MPYLICSLILYKKSFCTADGRLRPEPDNPAGAGTGTGIPVPVCQNRMWIFKFRFWYERTGHLNSGINCI